LFNLAFDVLIDSISCSLGDPSSHMISPFDRDT
jgi:hypothetical protein